MPIDEATSSAAAGQNGLLDRWIGTNGRTVVLFGGNPYRRDEVVRLLGSALDVTVIGTLSEGDGMAALPHLGDAVDVVVIGGAYSSTQRHRIREHVAIALSGKAVSEPGFEYPYDNDRIVADVAAKLESAR